MSASRPECGGPMTGTSRAPASPGSWPSSPRRAARPGRWPRRWRCWGAPTGRPDSTTRPPATIRGPETARRASTRRTARTDRPTPSPGGSPRLRAPARRPTGHRRASGATSTSRRTACRSTGEREAPLPICSARSATTRRARSPAGRTDRDRGGEAESPPAARGRRTHARDGSAASGWQAMTCCVTEVDPRDSRTNDSPETLSANHAPGQECCMAAKDADDRKQDEAEPEISLDMSQAAVKKMIAEAKERGYITYDQLNAVLPPDQTSSEQIEDVMSMLSDMGINVIEEEEADEADEAKKSTEV